MTEHAETIIAAWAVKHDGVRYAPGAAIPCTPAAARHLVAAGHAPQGAPEPQAPEDTGAGDAAPGRIEELEAAIRHMLTEDPGKKREDWWRTDGAPEARALAELTGGRVSAAERDAAWGQMGPVAD